MYPARISGIPCFVDVTSYHKGRPMRITGSGFGDADPPEPAEVEYEVYDRKGYRAHWLEAKITERENAGIENMLIEIMETREELL